MWTVTAVRKLKSGLLLGKRAMKNPDSVLKRHITLPTKVRKVKAMLFPVVIYDVKVGP